ncbi:YafY family protein [Isoptericola halotolerans]|uniref:Proteasome accessory factor B n=1 Tax=Isoptericola halotolerans TaxID=300560 RepID=A0ABX2A8F2_9MICO|nr:WYL domain-containing protein [Isoptericola halotolerans]NOV98072.1 proteasome accessory factor B [Isoptericola halotolerans]
MAGDHAAGEPPTRPDERLLNLVIALVNTSAAMTKQQVRSGVHGYGAAPSTEAFERMFERDKDTLRALGVPIVTVEGSGHSDEVGYRIDNDAYALPPVDLTPAELGVVALAAQLWSDKTLRTDMSRAMTKLAAAGAADAAGDAVAGLTPRLRAAGDAYGPLLEAVSERRVVTFRYRAANTGEVRTRTVEPWRIAARGGGWYVVGHDREREATRVFRLSRIDGRVRVGAEAGAYTIPDRVDVDAALGARVGAERTALLAVAPERAPVLRARAVGPGPGVPRAPRGRDVVAVPFRSMTAIADEVAGYGAAVLVVEPAELRSEVRRRLAAAARLDGGAGETGERHG